jgi:hypothetical protein
MNKNLLTNLKELRNIRPDSDYSKQSLNLILSSPQNRPLGDSRITMADFLGWFDFKHSAMLASAVGVLIFVILWVVSYFPGNKNSLVAEANEINASIQVKLNEIGYQLDSQKIDFSMAANIQNLLKTTSEELTQAQEELKNDPEKLKEAVEKIKKVEQEIAEINNLLK